MRRRSQRRTHTKEFFRAPTMLTDAGKLSLDVPSPDLEIIRQTRYGKKDDIAYKIAREKEIRDSHILNSLFHRRSFFVNCWHLADHESSAMWGIYAAPGPGVAVTTTPGRLKKALRKRSEIFYLGKVRYIDPTIEAITTNDFFELVVIKRNNYSHELEVRLVYWDLSRQDTVPKPRWRPDLDRFEMLSDDHPFLRTPFQAGRNFSCVLPELIEDIWISPRAPTWFAETLARLCKLAGLNNRIERSTLLDPPGVKKAAPIAPRIKNCEDLEDWLRGHGLKREDAVVIAARIALRVLPLVTRAEPRGENQEARRPFALTLATFRAAVLAWLAAKYPTSAETLSRSARVVCAAAGRSPVAWPPRPPASPTTPVRWLCRPCRRPRPGLHLRQRLRTRTCQHRPHYRCR